MTMLRNINLGGHLGKSFGRKFRFAVNTPGEAIRLLNVNFPGFSEALRKGWYRLVVGDRHTGQRWGLEELEMNLGRADFHLVPVVAGSSGPRVSGSRGKGGAIKAVLGMALVGAAIFFSGGTLAAPLGGLMGAGGSLTLTGNIAGLGLATALMGVSQIISPQQKSDTGTRKEDSYALNGPTNIPEQGYPVPVCIGQAIFGGIPVSVGYDVEDIAVGA